MIEDCDDKMRFQRLMFDGGQRFALDGGQGKRPQTMTSQHGDVITHEGRQNSQSKKAANSLTLVADLRMDDK